MNYWTPNLRPCHSGTLVVDRLPVPFDVFDFHLMISMNGQWYMLLRLKINDIFKKAY